MNHLTITATIDGVPTPFHADRIGSETDAKLWARCMEKVTAYVKAGEFEEVEDLDWELT